MQAAQRWIVRGAAVLLPLAYWPFTYDHYVLPKLLLARLVVLALAALALVQVRSFKRTPLDVPLVVFIASAGLSTAFSVNLNIAVFGTYARYDGLLTLITYALLLWLVVHSIGNREDAGQLLRYLLVGAYVVSVIAIVQWTAASLQGAVEPRAYGTLGNPNVLGAYLVLLMPAAYGELRQGANLTSRALAGNALVTMAVAVLLTVSYSAWLGLAAAAAILVAGGQLPAINSRRRQLTTAVVAVAVGAAAAPIALSRSTDVAQRLHIWRDTLPLIAGRPLVGYGPDTFGFVYPGFQTGRWVLGYLQIDKAHSEVLQIAATQGLIGFAAWAWLMIAFVSVFWRSRSWTLLAGFVAYEVVLLVNFTALSAALPFWIFAAAALHLAGAVTDKPVALWRPASRGAAAIALVLIVPGVAMPLLADQRLQDAVSADLSQRRSDAALAAAQAHALAPEESVYAVEMGNLGFESRDWAAARSGYGLADRIGTFNPTAYRNLALADLELGLRSEALKAATRAVYLDRYDPANQAVLAQLEETTP